ncbi:PilZ domain-containing protein [Thiocystis violacea]|uniref:PilZ domain-containing protein n=1 Tax=Thiocystis violacea TaxID=13725 RepID=UPI001F5B734D|nr:PilZ domain-containing protein [Thiocystis violacea]
MVRPIPAEEEEQAITSFADERSHASLANELRALRDLHLPQRRSLDYKFPTVSAYVRMLEKQIDMLALAIGDENGFSAAPNTLANLSAQGLSFDGGDDLATDALVELRLTLFPDRCHIRVLARVVRCRVDQACKSTALEFAHIREADREAIIRHIHLLQRLQLQASAEAEFDKGV